MKYFDWNEEKNDQLRNERNVSFEEVVIALSEGRLLEEFLHPDRKNHPRQKIYVVEINHYAYIIPFVEDDEKVFLKTIIPSRKATKKYLI